MWELGAATEVVVVKAEKAASDVLPLTPRLPEEEQQLAEARRLEWEAHTLVPGSQG